MKTMNYHGRTLTEKHYILPDKDSLALPLIRTPCYLMPGDNIDLTFSTQEDAKVKVCPNCGCTVIFATLSGNMTMARWHCLRGHGWDTERGIFYQLELFSKNGIGC